MRYSDYDRDPLITWQGLKEAGALVAAIVMGALALWSVAL